MPLIKPTAETAERRKHWEASRIKPTALRITRRRKDFREALKALREAVVRESITEIRKKHSGETVFVDNAAELALKKRSLPDAERFAAEISGKCKTFTLVPIKSGAMKSARGALHFPYAQRYFGAPSLFATRDYLEKNKPVSADDHAACEKLCKRAEKAGVDKEKLKEMVGAAIRELKQHHMAGNTNFLVFDVDNKKGKLKIGATNL
ncbi:Uncharacterised protein [uncultured archaeon]|nr:Uncharacterised protein [uncultured archaeon]